jgi:ribosomal protein S27AE
LHASLDGLPSLVGGVLSGCGFCLVWYRLRRLERHYVDEDAQAPRCQVCRRWLFETLAAYVRLDDDAKREHCPSCGGYNGPTLKSDDHDPPPPPVPECEDDADTQKFVVVSDDAPSPKDDGDATDPPPGCPDCGRTFFAESLAFYKALDDDDKRDYKPVATRSRAQRRRRPAAGSRRDGRACPVADSDGHASSGALRL